MRNLIAVTFVLLGVQAWAPAQDMAAQMRRLALIEEQEGDLRAAEAGYRDLLGAEKEPNARGTVALRLGSLLGRLGRMEEAAEVLAIASAASEELARQAAAVLQDPQQDPELARIQELISEFAADGDVTARVQWMGQAMVPEAIRQVREWRDQRGVWLRENGPIPGVREIRPGEDAGTWQQNWNHAQSQLRRVQLLWFLGGERVTAFLTEAVEAGDLWWLRWLAAGIEADRGFRGVSPSVLPALQALMAVEDPEGRVQCLAMTALPCPPVPNLEPYLRHSVAAVRLRALSRLRNEMFRHTEVFAAMAPAFSTLLRDPDVDVALRAWTVVSQIMLPEAAELFATSLPFARGKVRCPDNISLLPTDRWVSAVVDHGHMLDATWQTHGSTRNRVNLSWDQAMRLVAVNFATSTFLSLAWDKAEGDAELVAVMAAARTTDLASCIRSRFDQKRRRQGGELPLPPACVPELVRILELFQPGDARVEDPLYLAGSTPAPELLPAVLRFRVGRMKETTVWVLASLAMRLDSPELRVALREALVDPEVGNALRNKVLGCLAAYGDMDAVPTFVKMLETGLKCEGNPDHEGVGLQWLGGARRRDNPDVAVHGYSPEQLLTVWRALLEPPTRLQAMREAGFSDAPPELVVLWMETMLEYCRKPELEDGLPRVLERLSAGIDDSDQPTSVRIRELASEILRTPHRLLVVGSLSVAGMRGLRATLIDLLAKGQLSAGFRVIIYGLDVPAATLAQLIRRDKQTHWWNHNKLQMVPASDEVAEAIRVVLSGKEGHVDECRRLACEWLGANLRREAVPDLLLAAREPVLHRAATDALNTIRDYHAQQAYWTTDRIDTSPQAAAARLLAQAKPDATKEQRLLAIRSLGALGAPEALPHLIDWLTTTDTELQTAIRGAIAQIHDKAGVKAEPQERGR